MILEALLVATVAVPPAEAMKCPRTHQLPGYPEDSAVILVDGEVRGSGPDVAAMLDPEDIEGIEIKCWNPDTDELPASSGIPLILITTRAMKTATMDEVRDAANLVREFAREHGRMPDSVEELDPGQASGLELSRVGDGWHVSTTGPRALHCTAQVEAEGDPSVGCRSTYALARRSLREAYERGDREVLGRSVS